MGHSVQHIRRNNGLGLKSPKLKTLNKGNRITPASTQKGDRIKAKMCVTAEVLIEGFA
jgi:hypothetical protein